MQLLSGIILFCFLSANYILPFKKIIEIPSGTTDSVFAEYRYVTPDKDGLILLILKKDKSYSYSLANHIQHFSSTGRWEIRKDNLILNSFIQKNSLPIIIKEDSLNNGSKYLQVDWVKNLRGDIIHDAEILMNGDSSKHCMPVFENDCKIKSEELKRLQVRLSDNITSKWYAIKASNTNHIAITVNLDFNLENYIFFNRAIFIISGKKLYETEEKTVNKKILVKNKSYFLSKM